MFFTKCALQLHYRSPRNIRRNEEVIIRSGLRSVTDFIRERRHTCFGYFVRMTGGRFPRKVIKWLPTGKRERERPKLFWKETDSRDIKKEVRNRQDAQEGARDRQLLQFISARCAMGTGRTKVQGTMPISLLELGLYLRQHHLYRSSVILACPLGQWCLLINAKRHLTTASPF